MNKHDDKSVQIVKVVSRFFLADIWASVQNFFGSNLTSYERMVQDGIQQIQDELNDTCTGKLAWHRYEITQLGNGAICILFYGELK